MWKVLPVSVFFICIMPALLYAGPALEEYQRVRQPDGTTFKARKRGDEFQNWTETESGHTIVRNRKTDYWEFASLKSDGSLQPSGQTVMPGKQPPAEFPLHLKPRRNNTAELAQSDDLRNIFQQRLKIKPTPLPGLSGSASLSSPGDWTPVPVSGPRRVILILVNFTDRALVTSPSGWGSAVFSTAAGVKSVANYYKDNSFNTLSVTPVPHTQPNSPAGVVSVSVPYVHPDNGTPEETWVVAAITAADAFVNFASLDTDNNGYIDRNEAVVYLVPAGYEETATHKVPSVWAHARRYFDSGLSAAGKLFPVYAMSGELNHYDEQHPIGVIAHELGHQFCGLPDLYDTSGSNQGLGQFSLMASGSWGADIGESGGATPTNLDAWSREYLGWLTPLNAGTSAAITLAHPLSSQSAAYKLVDPAVSASEYFLVENRQPVGWDKGLRGGLAGFGGGWAGGLLISHIDITSGTAGYNNINNYYNETGHQGVIPVQASTASCDMLSFGAVCRGSASTLYFSGNNSSWTPITNPDSSYHSGAASGFNLVDISAPAAIMSARFDNIPPVYKSISVVKSGTGSGTVSSLPAGLSCGDTCSAPFIMGATIRLTATPTPGFGLSSWSGGGCSGSGPCTLTVTDDTEISASFDPSATVDIGSAEVPRAIYDNYAITSALTVPAGLCSTLADVSVKVNIKHTAVGDLKVSLNHNESGRNSDLFNRSCGSNDNITATFADEAAELACPPAGSYRPASPLSVFDGLDPAGTWTLSVADNATFNIGMLAEWGVSFSCLNALTVSVAGSGAGTVTSSPQSASPPGISCTSGTCSASFPGSTLVALLPSPDSYSTFGGWGGSCTGNGLCSVTMNLPKSVAAFFSLAPLVINQESGQPYDTLQSAYNSAFTSNTIKARINGSPLKEPLVTLNRGIDITIKGGYDAAYVSNTGYTTVEGRIIIQSGLLSNGAVRVERLIVKSPR